MLSATQRYIIPPSVLLIALAEFPLGLHGSESGSLAILYPSRAYDTLDGVRFPEFWNIKPYEGAPDSLPSVGTYPQAALNEESKLSRNPSGGMSSLAALPGSTSA